jgi:hypothetical protein
VHPGITLSVDLAFFLGVLFLGRGVPALVVPETLETRQVLAAGVWTVASFALAFGVTPMFAPGEAGAAAERSASTESVSLPEEGYYIPDYGEWIGRSFGDLPIAKWIQGGPIEMPAGRSFALLYRKDCEHCHELMEVYFSGELAWPTLAIAIPERSGFPTENVQPMPCQECRTATLPSGVDWFFQTPVLIRLQDGIVECASEASAADPRCLEW